MHAHPLYFVLYLLAGIAYLVAIVNPKPAKEYQLNIVALGLLLTLLPTILEYAQS